MNPASGKPSKGSAIAACDSLGIKSICDMLTEGESLAGISRKLGINIASLLTWIGDDANRTAQASKARTSAALVYDEDALRGLEHAQNHFELARAKEIAHHLRWRASKFAPRLYGDKLQTELHITGSVDITQHKESLRQMLDLNPVPRGTVATKPRALPSELAHDIAPRDLVDNSIDNIDNAVITVDRPTDRSSTALPVTRSIDQGEDKRTAKEKRNAYMAKLMRERRAKLKGSV